ncbi:unnamed protein product [Closterium sp. NIES-54]
MVQQVLQHFDFTWSSPQPTSLSTGHLLSAPPSDEFVEPTGPYPELVGCLICEAEIYAGAMAAQELRWLTYLLTDLSEWPRSPPFLYVDNTAMIVLCQDQRLEHRTKHIALRSFLTRELQQRGQLRLAYVATQANTADVFAKALESSDHQRFCNALGLVPTLPHLLGPPQSATPLVASPCWLSRRLAGCRVALLAVVSPCPAHRVALLAVASPCPVSCVALLAIVSPCCLRAALQPARRPALPALSCPAARTALLRAALLLALPCCCSPCCAQPCWPAPCCPRRPAVRPLCCRSFRCAVGRSAALSVVPLR